MPPNNRAKILESFHKVWPWNKLKGPVFSVIRYEGYVNFLIGKVLQVLYFPSNAAVKTENLKEDFLRSFFSNFALPVIENYDPVCRKWKQVEVGNESRLKKLTEVSNYRKFICNIFGWDIEKIGIIRAKIQIIVRI